MTAFGGKKDFIIISLLRQKNCLDGFNIRITCHDGMPYIDIYDNVSLVPRIRYKYTFHRLSNEIFRLYIILHARDRRVRNIVACGSERSWVMKKMFWTSKRMSE